jgi:capsular polysaccharide biosynthesis protein
MHLRKTVLPITITTLILTALGLSVDAFAQNPTDQSHTQIKSQNINDKISITKNVVGKFSP